MKNNPSEFSIIAHKLIKLDLVMKLYSRKNLDEFGLHFGQIPIMNYIAHNPGCTQVQISDYLTVSPASIALSTKRLEKSGFIVKITDENNLRCKNLSLTEKGKLALMKCFTIRDAQDKKMFNGFSVDDLKAFSSFLDKATMNLTDEKENFISKSVVRELEKQIEELQTKK